MPVGSEFAGVHNPIAKAARSRSGPSAGVPAACPTSGSNAPRSARPWQQRPETLRHSSIIHWLGPEWLGSDFHDWHLPVISVSAVGLKGNGNGPRTQPFRPGHYLHPHRQSSTERSIYGKIKRPCLEAPFHKDQSNGMHQGAFRARGRRPQGSKTTESEMFCKYWKPTLQNHFPPPRNVHLFTVLPWTSSFIT